MAASNSRLSLEIGAPKSVDPPQIQPKELSFHFRLYKKMSSFVTLHNKGHQCMAFKVKTTKVEKYCVRPNTGIVLPGSFCDITVTMAAQKETPSDMQCSDKFLIKTVVVPDGTSPKDLTPEMFNRVDGKFVGESKFRVVYILANPPSPDLEVSRKGFPFCENGNNNTSSASPTYIGIKPKITVTVATVTSNLQESSKSDVTSTSDLKDQLAKLSFPFELRRQSSCSMILTNKTLQFVAFKVKTTHTKKYCVRPNTDVLLPGASCDVTVTMQAQKEAPADMLCNDKFLIQSVAVPDGTSKKDLTSEMFNKDERKVVEELKLRVVYTLASTKELTSEMFNKEERKVVEELKSRVVYTPANPEESWKISPFREKESSIASLVSDMRAKFCCLKSNAARYLGEPEEEFSEVSPLLQRLLDDDDSSI